MREKLTRKDVEKIEQEIEHRKLVIRKEAIEAVKEARAQGDLSENFEYYAAKRHKNQNESRIRYLENMLKTATIVSDKSSNKVLPKAIWNTLYEAPCIILASHFPHCGPSKRNATVAHTMPANAHKATFFRR